VGLLATAPAASAATRGDTHCFASTKDGPHVGCQLDRADSEVTNVSLGEQGADRITVRLSSAIIGAAQPGWHPVNEVTRLDWDFVRPTGQRTDPGAVLLPRTCANCGSPYHSDLDDACPHCRTGRPDTHAGWHLDRTDLMVDA
jgi:hypothetical protein